MFINRKQTVGPMKPEDVGKFKTMKEARAHEKGMRLKGKIEKHEKNVKSLDDKWAPDWHYTQKTPFDLDYNVKGKVRVIPRGDTVRDTGTLEYDTETGKVKESELIHEVYELHRHYTTDKGKGPLKSAALKMAGATLGALGAALGGASAGKKLTGVKEKIDKSLKPRKKEVFERYKGQTRRSGVAEALHIDVETGEMTYKGKL